MNIDEVCAKLARNRNVELADKWAEWFVSEMKSELKKALIAETKRTEVPHGRD